VGSPQFAPVLSGYGIAYMPQGSQDLAVGATQQQLIIQP